nr:hypothetical protein [Mycoplasmopsis bovis]
MKKTRFLLLSIASIAPLITISSIGCFVSDKEYKSVPKKSQSYRWLWNN